ncbi:hypothetical protein [Gordonia malaquae]|uniref:hypothetical protein n=1 Tax=Gordonia malaquae TaxID=410332 RepID=UPI0030FDFE80
MIEEKDVAMVDDLEVAASEGNDVSESPTVQDKRQSKKSRLREEAAQARAEARRWRRISTGVGVLAVILIVALTVVTWSRMSTAHELADTRSSAQSGREDLAEAAGAANAYAKKSLTIDSTRAREYVQGLAAGTTSSFGKTFDLTAQGAGTLTLELIQQLKMQSTGEIAYTHFDGDVDALPGDGQPWNFVVTAKQTATTVQQPERTTSAVILRVVVVHMDGRWLVSSFAPDPKIQVDQGAVVPGPK